MSGAVGQTPKTIREFSRELEVTLGMGIQDAQKSEDGVAFSTLSREITVDDDVAPMPYLQAGSRARRHPIGTPIKTTTVKSEYQSVELEKLSDSIALKTIDLHRSNMRSLLLGEVETKAGELENEKWLWMLDQLENGDSNTKYQTADGAQFFSTTHSLFGQSYSNLLTGDLDATTEAGRAAWEAATTRIREIPWVGGYPLNTAGIKLYLVVPPALRHRAFEMVGPNKAFQPNINSGNPYEQEAEIIVADQLTNDTDWYILGVKGNLTPFTFAKHVEEGDWQMVSKVNADDENRYQRQQYEWYWWSLCAVWMTFYPFAIKVQGTGS